MNEQTQAGKRFEVLGTACATKAKSLLFRNARRNPTGELSVNS